MTLGKLYKIIKNPKELPIKINYRYPFLLKWMDDKKNLEFWYKYCLGTKLNLDNPRTFNEKMQWLKLNYRKSEFTEMVDKQLVKEYVSKIIGERYIIPTLGIWSEFKEIDFARLPNQFVLKCTHDSGGLVICKDKSKLDLKKVEKRITRSMKRNFFWVSREWPYKNVNPKIICEQYMQDGENEHLNVYKIFNFGGIPRLIQTIQNDKQVNETIDYFDVNWELLDLRQNFPNSKEPLGKPDKLDEMLKLARKLSKDIPFLRTDFYEINGQVYFSELTFYSDAGLAKYYPEEWDEKLGELILLPQCYRDDI